MIPYMVGKLTPNSTYSTRGLVEYFPGRGYFRAVPSQNGDRNVTSPPPSIVERVDCPVTGSVSEGAVKGSRGTFDTSFHSPYERRGRIF